MAAGVGEEYIQTSIIAKVPVVGAAPKAATVRMYLNAVEYPNRINLNDQLLRPPRDRIQCRSKGIEAARALDIVKPCVGIGCPICRQAGESAYRQKRSRP